MLPIMALSADNKIAFISGELECRENLLVSQKPVAGIIILVGAAILQEDSQRLGFSLTNERGQILPATQIGKAADKAHDPMENIWPVPGRIERCNAAGTRSGDGIVVRIFGEIVVLADLGQNFFDEKTRIAVPERVIFKAAVIALPLGGRERRQHSGIDKNSDSHRHVALGNQVIEDDGNTK